jgi:cell division septation protein DedD
MRDTHRLKEKYEVSLENRHVVTITATALLVVAGVFMVGVVVGKKLASEATAQTPATDILSQTDAKTAALDSVNQETDLTFQEELTKKLPVPVEQASAAPVAVAPKLAAPNEAPPAVAKAPKSAPPSPSPSQDPPPSDPTVDSSAQEDLARAVLPPRQPDPVLEMKAAAEAPRPITAQVRPESTQVPAPARAEPAPARAKEKPGLKEAFGKVQPRATESAGGSAWTIQISASQEKTEADRLAGGLRDKGYAPFVTEAQIIGKGTWYRVRVGQFANREAANRYLDDFKRETMMNAFVTAAK